VKGWGYPDVRAFKLSREPQTPINTASTLRNEANHLIPKSKPGRVDSLGFAPALFAPSLVAWCTSKKDFVEHYGEFRICNPSQRLHT